MPGMRVDAFFKIEGSAEAPRAEAPQGTQATVKSN
jgi:hypothetical protein